MKGKVRVNLYAVPLFVAFVALAAGILAPALRTPTFSEARTVLAPGSSKTAVFEIAGVSCYGTSKTLAKWVFELRGTAGVTTYSSNREVRVSYDPAVTSADEIVMAIEKEVDLGGKKARPFAITRYRESEGAEWVVLRKENAVEVDEL